ncbi:MAG: creatininase family protein [Chloroflexota bacterium]
MTVYDARNTWWELRAQPPELAILPVGATEACGPHLPVGAMNLILGAIARAVAERLAEDVYLLPTWPLGANPQYRHLAGSVSLSWRALLAALTDVVNALRRSGIHRVAVLAGLGGAGHTTALPFENEIVKTAVRQLNYAHPDLTAIWVQPLTVADPPLATLYPAAQDEVRAGAIVTSLMLHLHPDLVRPLPADHVPPETPDGAAPARLSYLRALPFEALCPLGVWGRPSQASAELGDRILRAASDGTARYITETLVQVARLKGAPAQPGQPTSE